MKDEVKAFKNEKHSFHPSSFRLHPCFFLSVVGFIRRVAGDGDVTAGEAKLAQLVLEGLAMHAEDGGGARDVAAGFFQTAGDITTLELAPVFAKVRREGDDEPSRRICGGLCWCCVLDRLRL